MNYIYILECADGSYYTGSTKNLEKRLWEHQNGQGANHTQKHLPVKLVYCEPYDRIDDAFYREKQVQGWSRRKKQALIESNYENLIEFSKNYTEYGRPEERPAAASTSSASATPPPELVEGELVEGELVEGELRTPLPELVEGELRTPLPELVEGNTESAKLDVLIRQNLEGLGYGE